MRTRFTNYKREQQTNEKKKETGERKIEIFNGKREEEKNCRVKANKMLYQSYFKNRKQFDVVNFKRHVLCYKFIYYTHTHSIFFFVSFAIRFGFVSLSLSFSPNTISVWLIYVK